MPKVTTVNNNLTNGEVSPLALGRFDLAKYINSAKTMLNWLVNQLGGGFFRPGTRYLASTKDNGIARLMPFQYSADQDYVMEMGDEYIRMYSNDGDAITITGWDADMVLLLHCNGTDGEAIVTDETGKLITVHNTANTDTAQKKFGSASLGLDGDSDYLTILDSDDFNVASSLTTNYTIQFFVKHSLNGALQYYVCQGTPAVDTQYFSITKLADNTIKVDINAVGGQVITMTSVATIADTDWYHIAVCKVANLWGLYLDGVQIAYGTQATTTTYTGLLYVGRKPGGADFMTGWMDEIRFDQSNLFNAAPVVGLTDTITVPTTEYAILSSTEITSPYLEADVFDVYNAHKNDVKYMTHLDYAPRKLSRTDATTFTLATVGFVRGPFLDTNTAATTITASADTGDDITLTASVAIFDETHVNSLWRIDDGVVKITAVAAGGLKTTATADVQAEPDGSAGDLNNSATPSTDWAEGAFSGYRGYPKVCAFHQGRLYYANTDYEPQKVWGSNLYGYDNFETGSAGDDEAVTFEIASEERTAIVWASSSSKALTLGSTGGTFSVAGTNGGVITPSDIQVDRDTNYGAAGIEPKRISSFLYYVQRNLRKVRELSYFYDTDANRALDMTLLAEHILKDGDGIIQMDHQQAPNDRLWCVRDDGQLAVLTRNPEQEVMGWCRMVAGTDSTQAGKFESVVVVPKENDNDQIWVVVNRTIDGVTKRFIEYFTTEDFDDYWDAVRVDCSLTLDSPITITGATSADPVVVTAASHGFSNGDQVKITGVTGMTEINEGYFLVANKTDDTFELTDLDSADIDGSAYSTYISGGEVRKMVTAISGLSHLEGETVTVQVDGSIPSTETYVVASGAITLSQKAAVVHVGLPYTGTLQLPKFSDGSPTGTGQTKERRIYGVTLRVNRSLGLNIGLSTDKLDSLIPYAFDSDDKPPSLHTGDYPEERPKHFQVGWGRSDEIIIQQSKPLPAHILAVITESQVEG